MLISARHVLILVGLTVAMMTSAAAQQPWLLQIDARDVTQGIQHAKLHLPVTAGPLTLAYPKWIPGEHAPDGPLTQLMSLQIIGGDQPIPWKRDSLDPFLFHLDVPSGVSELDIRFDYVSPAKSFGDGYGKTPNATPHLLILPFNHFILYPADAAADAIRVKAEVLIPDGWKFDDALRPYRLDGARIFLPETSLYTLVDSPLLAGEFFRTFSITTGERATRLSVAANAPGDLAVNEEFITGMRRLVAEAGALFGPGHYREYVWLVALGNTLDLQNGLEHHESTDIRDSESLFTDPQRLIEARTIPHEYVHSWNGKYRRPDGLATPNYQHPMVDDLLWVYEGMTRYLGDFVLRARSGLSAPEQTRDYLAWIASLMDVARPGRTWRSLADTATALPGYNDAPSEWVPMRRRRDYYDEMLLIWLEADTRIRQQSGNRVSLDDFCRRFFGGSAGTPEVRPYSRADLMKELQAVAPLSWDNFFTERVDTVNPHAPLQGIKNGGWALTYDDSPNAFLSAREKVDEADNLSLSLGIWVKADGTVVDVVKDLPAFAAGIAPGMRLLAIDGHKWTINFARESIMKAEKTSQPMELIVETADLVRTVRVNYHDGLRNPHLVRLPDAPDLLSAIMGPKAQH